MDAIGTAVGIASLGIQVCQGLLAYYDGWKAYPSDISETYESIADLSRTLTLLTASLKDDGLDRERAERVKGCLQSCETALGKLSKKAQKLKKDGLPRGLQKPWSEMQRMWYPFRASTLVKLRELVSDIQDRLQLAMQVLQLDTGQRSRRLLNVLDARTSDMDARTSDIDTRLRIMQQSDQFDRIQDWLSPPDPWTNHYSARQRCEAQTGAWLLQSHTYQSWKAGSAGHIWLHGKAGCGKTVLCSTAIDDVQAYCRGRENAGVAVFYFSFSDTRKQTEEDLLRSLVAQLGRKEPALSLLQKMHSGRVKPGRDDLEKVLLVSMASYDEVFLMLDALDESPETSDVRQDMLQRVDMLTKSCAASLKVLATSRELRDIREAMQMVNANAISIPTSAVNADIRKYVSTQLSRDHRFRGLNAAMKSRVETTISQRADGMFRWAYCQLQELKKLKSFRPSFVEKALNDLPASLDETYSRMLMSIDEMYRKDAITLLQWLAYAQYPPSLGELVEAVIIDPKGDVVRTDDRGGVADTVDLLSGLVMVVRGGRNSDDAEFEGFESGSDVNDAGDPQIDVKTRVRLAHFSVKEYLESKRILDSAADFHLESTTGHSILAQSCLMYLLYYSGDDQKTSTVQDFDAYPLLNYAVESWYWHSSLQPQNVSFRREVSLLTSDRARTDWLYVQQPDRYGPSFRIIESVGSGLYYAAYLGLDEVVQKLLDAGADVNVPGGFWETALIAASNEGHEKVVQTLLDTGAYDLWGEDFGRALIYASIRGRENVVQVLLDFGGDITARTDKYISAILSASASGNGKVLRMLLDAGADVLEEGATISNLLQMSGFKRGKDGRFYWPGESADVKQGRRET